MSITTIFVSDLETPRARILVANAETVFTYVDDSKEFAMLFESGESGGIVAIELFDGEIELESISLSIACKMVESVKGRCDFAMSHAGVDLDAESVRWLDAGLGDEESSGRTLFDDEDADDWKGGGPCA